MLSLSSGLQCCNPPSAGMSVAFIAFFGAGASAAAFFAPFFAMLIDGVFGSQGTCKVKA